MHNYAVSSRDDEKLGHLSTNPEEDQEYMSVAEYNNLDSFNDKSMIQSMHNYAVTGKEEEKQSTQCSSSNEDQPALEKLLGITSDRQYAIIMLLYAIILTECYYSLVYLSWL